MSDVHEKDLNDLEEGSVLQLDYGKLMKVGQSNASVLPVAVQDVNTKDVLIIAYANDLAVQHTIEEGIATFWSTSRNELWVKGATSGDYLEIVDIRVNCEQNSLLYMVRPKGEGACHTKDKAGKARSSCYYRLVKDGVLDFVAGQD